MNDSVPREARVIPRRTGAACSRLAALFDRLAVLLVEHLLVDIFAMEEGRVARIGDAHFLQHLADDDLNVLIVDIDALEAIDLLHLVDEILLEFADAANIEDLLQRRRVLRSAAGPFTTMSPFWTIKCLVSGMRCSSSMPVTSSRTTTIRLFF